MYCEVMPIPWISAPLACPATLIAAFASLGGEINTRSGQRPQRRTGLWLMETLSVYLPSAIAIIAPLAAWLTASPIVLHGLACEPLLTPVNEASTNFVSGSSGIVPHGPSPQSMTGRHAA